MGTGIVLAAEKLEKKQKLKQIVPLYEQTEVLEFRTTNPPSTNSSSFELDKLRTTYKFGDEQKRFDNLSAIFSHINNQGYTIVSGDENDHLEKKFLGLVGKETIERTGSKRHYVDLKIVALYEKSKNLKTIEYR